MSKVMTLCAPASRAVTWAPTTPVLGPDNTVRTGSRAAASNPITPPFDCVKYGVAATPSALSRSATPRI
jgi:hypothetical protein